MLLKSGPRDHSIPNSFRPISLLSCIGKGLERLISQRMANLAVKYNILSRYQCSATPMRSAVDLTTTLVTDI